MDVTIETLKDGRVQVTIKHNCYVYMYKCSDVQDAIAWAKKKEQELSFKQEEL